MSLLKKMSFGLEISSGSFQAYQLPNAALQSTKSKAYKQTNKKS